MHRSASAIVVNRVKRAPHMSGVVRYAPRQIGKLLLIAVPALALPFIIRTAVVEGVATATEVSTIGIFYTVLAGIFIYRKFDWKRIYPMLLDTASLSGAILIIVGCATAMKKSDDRRRREGWCDERYYDPKNNVDACATIDSRRFLDVDGHAVDRPLENPGDHRHCESAVGENEAAECVE